MNMDKHIGAILYITIFLVIFSQIKLYGQLDSTRLPLVIINTISSPHIPDEPKIQAKLKIIYNENNYNYPSDKANIYNGYIGIETRGAFSRNFPQKSYSFETQDSLGENLNVPMFHMPKENDWILQTTYNDRSFLRNTLAYDLFSKMGHYAPRTKFCEVILNNSYRGIYIFTEKIKRDDNRVNISKLNPDENVGDDLTGGYIFKIDGDKTKWNNLNTYFIEYEENWKSSYAAANRPKRNAPFDFTYSNFKSELKNLFRARSIYFTYTYPKAKDITETQKLYIQSFVKEFESSLHSAKNDEYLQAVSNYIDEDSFIDYFLVNEFSRNMDGFSRSRYFYKDKASKGGKLYAGPVWDFDWGWKNVDKPCIFGAMDGSGWAHQAQICIQRNAIPVWMVFLLKDPEFTQRLKNRYKELRSSFLSETYLFNYIDSVATHLEESQSRHHEKWQRLGCNPTFLPEVDPIPTTYAGEIRKIKLWVEKRLCWLDANIPVLGNSTEITYSGNKQEESWKKKTTEGNFFFDFWKDAKKILISKLNPY